MAKSQSEPFRIAKSRQGEKENNAWPGQELNVVRGFSLVQKKEHDPEGSHYRPKQRGSLK